MWPSVKQLFCGSFRKLFSKTDPKAFEKTPLAESPLENSEEEVQLDNEKLENSAQEEKSSPWEQSPAVKIVTRSLDENGDSKIASGSNRSPFTTESNRSPFTTEPEHSPKLVEDSVDQTLLESQKIEFLQKCRPKFAEPLNQEENNQEQREVLQLKAGYLKVKPNPKFADNKPLEVRSTQRSRISSWFCWKGIM